MKDSKIETELVHIEQHSKTFMLKDGLNERMKDDAEEIEKYRAHVMSFEDVSINLEEVLEEIAKNEIEKEKDNNV